MRNLEAKFRLSDLAGAVSRAAKLGYTRRAILNQRDTFFRVSNGKLKLREENGGGALIHYRRDGSGPLMLSNYEIVNVSDPAKMAATLKEALGVLAVVEKQRVLMMRDNVRFHLDTVASLGAFGEIEAVISDGDDPERSRAAVDSLLTALGIAPPDLIDVSYFELMLAASTSK
ncbi:MAG TPA: class IV adenylate cyclase [Candidatus Binataceae bacterium]|nr:class IV adenylate cyclase [Candidatus Binataceae bacterium]